VVVVPLRLQRGVVVARFSVEESPARQKAFDGTLAQSDGVTLARFHKLEMRDRVVLIDWSLDARADCGA
jgi:hypothetical protein